MSILTITPNLEKKTAKFKGTVAAGEHVSVSIENASEISTSGLRLRVIDHSGNTLAMFPEPSLEEGMDGVGDWGGGGSVLTCELSLNTAPMHKAVCGMCERELTVVLDNVAEKELHFVGQHTFLGWPKEKGSDIPYDFDEFPKLIDDWIRQIENLTLTAKRDDAEGKVKITVWDGRGGTDPVVVTIYDGDTSNADEFASQAASAANAAARSASEAKTALAAADTKIAAAKSEAVASANSHSDGELQKHKIEADGTFAKKTALDEINTNLTKEADRAKTAENAIDKKAQDALNKYTQTLSTAQEAGIKAEEATKAALDAVSKIIGGAPEALDTLKEIAEWIAKDETGTQALLTQITGLTNLVSKKADTTAVAKSLNGKVDKVPGKGLSTNDYTNVDKEKLDTITDEEGFVKKARYAETALDADNAAFANHSEHANNAELATASQSSMALFPYSGSHKDQRSAELIFSQIDEKRKLNDNIAAADSTVLTDWVFSDGKSYSMSVAPNVPMNDPVKGEYVEGYVYYFDANSYYPSAFFQVTAYTVDENPLELKFNISGNEALSIWPNGLSATRKKVVITKTGEPYVTPTGVKNIAIPKYEFVTATITDGKVTVAPYTNAKLVSDGTAFTVAVGGESGYMRDCVLRVECGETAPTITWGTNFHPRTDAETDFACVAGVKNVYWITEYSPNEFVVAGWQETTGGNAS